MKQVLELIPIALFFIAYQMNGQTVTLGDFSHEFNGMFSATAVLMIATVVQVIALLAIYKKLEKRDLWTAAAVIAFGSLTLFFRNELFIQWKPTIFNWVLAVVFLGFPLFGGKTLLQKTLGAQLTLPQGIWNRLNLVWVIHFTIVGALNIYVAYQYAEATWVSYKLYSAIGFTILLSILTVIILAPHIKQQSAES